MLAAALSPARSGKQQQQQQFPQRQHLATAAPPDQYPGSTALQQQRQQLPAVASDRQLSGALLRQAVPMSEDGATPERPASAPPQQQPDSGGDVQPEQPTPPASALGSATDPHSGPGSLATSSRSSSQELLQPMQDALPPGQSSQQPPQQPTLRQPAEAAAVAGGVDVAAPAERAALAQLMRGGGGGGGRQSDSNVAEWGECLDSETLIEAVPLQQLHGAAALPPHRFYVQATPTSMRLATVMVSED